MNVTTTSHAVTVDIPASTNCSSGVFCNKMTKPLTAIKSYVSSRAHAITHLKCKKICTGLLRLGIGFMLGMLITEIYGFIVTKRHTQKFTDEQVNIFFATLGVSTVVATLITDICFYYIENS